DALVERDVVLADRGDPSDRDVGWVDRAERARLPAGGDELVAQAHALVLADMLEAAAGLDDPAGPRVDVGRGDPGRVVGQQRNEGLAIRDLHHRSDEAGVGDDRIVHLNSVGRAGANQDLLHKRRWRLREDVRADVAVLARVTAAVDEMELLAEGGVLAGRSGVLGRLLPELVDLAAEAV